MDSGHLTRLTPQSVHSLAFRPARRGRRGLDHEHVQEFCQLVEAELAMLADERTALQDEVRRLRQRILGADGGAPGAERDSDHVQAVGILSQAQKTADRYIADAQEYSRHLAEHARRRRDEMLDQARSQAGRVLEQAHLEAGRAGRNDLEGGQAGRDDLEGGRAGRDGLEGGQAGRDELGGGRAAVTAWRPAGRP
jgi:cell division septum initiation protein DivIVA